MCCIAQAYALLLLGGAVQVQAKPSGEHVVGPLPVDARRLGRRPEDDVEGVRDAGDVAQQRQEEGDEEFRLHTYAERWLIRNERCRRRAPRRVEARNAYAAAAVAEEDAQRREDRGEDDLEARRAAAGAHPGGTPALRGHTHTHKLARKVSLGVNLYGGTTGRGNDAESDAGCHGKMPMGAFTSQDRSWARAHMRPGRNGYFRILAGGRAVTGRDQIRQPARCDPRVMLCGLLLCFCSLTDGFYFL